MMGDKPPSAWSQWRDGLCRRHPLLLWLLVMAIAFLTGPLMIAANTMTAVLYKDF
jgi:hypothetical protein